jgi:general secretion pathway protein M
MTSSVLQQFRTALAASWSARSASERKLLGIAGVALALLLVAMVLIVPALNGRTQLHKQIPALRAQVAQMQALSEQAANYTSQAPNTAPLSAKDVETTLQSHGLKASNLNVSADMVQVQLGDAAFASVVAWLAEMQQHAHATVSETTITPLPQAGKVDAKITMQQYRTP